MCFFYSAAKSSAITVLYNTETAPATLFLSQWPRADS